MAESTNIPRVVQNGANLDQIYAYDHNYYKTN